MKRLLIASESKNIADILAEHFQEEYEVYACADGNEALQLLQSITPDILIISLTLSSITGLSVLQQTSYKPPVIIALTNYLTDSILQEIQAVGAGALIRLPCSIKCIANHLKSLLNK